jgi:hypothetical protein
VRRSTFFSKAVLAISAVVLPVFLTVVLPVVLTGCGVKTHPYPEIVTLPAKVENFTQTLDSDGNLWLSFAPSQTNIAERPVQTLDHFEIWGADYDLEDFCQGCPVKTQKLADVYLDAPAPGQSLAPGPYSWQTKPRPGRVHVYRVAGFSPRGAVHPDAWSETTVWMLPHPGELHGFTATPEDLAVKLNWPPAQGDLVVEVQRQIGEGPFTTLDPSKEGSLDLSVGYGSQYAYRARWVRVKDDTRIPGPWTTPARVAIEDYIAPAPPSYVDVSMTADGVQLSWESRADDQTVLGYYLYRRLGQEKNFARLGGLFKENIYLDKTVQPGVEVRYRVTAVDTSPQANESYPSPEGGIFYGPIEPPSAEEERPVFEDPGL